MRNYTKTSLKIVNKQNKIKSYLNGLKYMFFNKNKERNF